MGDARYDVIIVGAGSAGCVLANRLSEDAARSVLLIEAGPDFPSLKELPPDIAKGLDVGHSCDWGYMSQPSAAVAGRSIPLLRGKLTGGCSAVNVTFSMRGWPDDYDGWEALGNKGWSFADVLPYFRKLETDRDFDNEWHGQDGPHPVRRQVKLSETHNAFAEACVALGHRRVDDHNQPGEVGVGPVPVNTVDGIRQSTALTYLAPARGRQNLMIMPKTNVVRVVLDGDKAVGVITADGRTISGGEIILSGGSYASPAILLRSGIGDAAAASALGIEHQVQSAGVGRGLIEHPLIGIVFHTDVLLPGHLPGLQNALSAVQGEYRFHVWPWHQPSGSPGAPDVFAIIGGLLNPDSRGNFSLASADPDAAPRIDLGLLTDERDVTGMMELVRMIWRISRAAPLVDILQPSMIDAWVEEDDARLEKFVRETVEVYHHPVGTCRMGADDLAVVDSVGCVRGVAGLRVVDASIMPSPVAAQTNVPTIMIAEKLSEAIAGGK